MKTTLLLAAAFLTTVPAPFAQDVVSPNETNTAKIPLITLQTPGIVIGKLAVPLGTVVILEGNMETLPASHPKGDEEFGWLRVDSINGTSVDSKILLNFKWFEATEKSVLKDRVRIVGYETGEFVGVPSAAFSYIPPVGTPGFYFRSYFIALKKL